ncbi:MAG: hypothetical protein ABI723_02835 [Bacteroidia bacterium]
MKEQHLHIVSFDIPYPPNYGGVIDVFYKIKSLHQLGVKVHLHCFEYGRKETDAMNAFCETVNYYKRNSAKSQLFNRLPYIIISRASEELIKNLLNDESPILFEGLHCCYFLNDARLKNRIKIVRTHNVEHDYYQSLARVEKDIFKRYYFYNEAAKLEAFEPALQQANYIAAISLNDTNYFQYRFKNARYIPAFHSNESINCKTGKGEYALYHGNLSIGENNEAALYLVNEVFNDSEYKLILSGSKPSKELRDAVQKKPNIEILADVSIEKIISLITEAHINILPTFQPTGIKLKLLSALFNGRHCLVNDVMVANTNLDSLCHIAHNAEEFKNHLKKLFEEEFKIRELEKRKKILNENFSNDVSAKKLLDLLG